MTGESIYVGPAKVLRCDADGRPLVQVLGGAGEQAVAEWAIPFRYEPNAGDLLLVLGRAGRYWVTGIVHGSGRSQLAFRGDAELRARGALHLGGNGGARVDAPEVRVAAEELHSEAEHTAQRVGEYDSTVRGTLDERAGECARTIDGEDEQVAAKHETVARRVVKVDGGLLRLS